MSAKQTLESPVAGTTVPLSLHLSADGMGKTISAIGLFLGQEVNWQASSSESDRSGFNHRFDNLVAARFLDTLTYWRNNTIALL